MRIDWSQQIVGLLVSILGALLVLPVGAWISSAYKTVVGGGFTFDCGQAWPLDRLADMGGYYIAICNGTERTMHDVRTQLRVFDDFDFTAKFGAFHNRVAARVDVSKLDENSGERDVIISCAKLEPKDTLLVFLYSTGKNLEVWDPEEPPDGKHEDSAVREPAERVRLRTQYGGWAKQMIHESPWYVLVMPFVVLIVGVAVTARRARTVNGTQILGGGSEQNATTEQPTE